ncbi:cadmium carbonic anhydrase repeat-domain containing protein [Nitzschia inconspicua]|uniref:Cadmium carbonic anhydrase repeat-domain containing protein n=1 Tax=Nitzschia inconspicua TaxID=303405 RepID=A0A9K3LKP9_9STRA|nr:cadmium carbonic anhydrase repeat-domain containing protein [Nitzschia inconspicua]
MCPAPDIDEEKKQTVGSTASSPDGCMGPKFMAKYVAILLLLLTVCAIIMVAELSSLVSFASKSASPATIIVNPSGSVSSAEGAVSESSQVPDDLPPAITIGENICAGKKPDLPNVDCIVDALTNVGPQAGANVTAGYTGNMTVDHVPITTPYWMNGMCPVNVHWHLGAEHLSVGQYDENGGGPDEADGEIRQGHQCNIYDAEDPKFTRPYDWKYCKDMEVGQTYEVHWPHSAAGACGTPNQYQTPFYDGVFCVDDVLTDTASQIGVQAQVFIVVNDDTYFWPDLMRGMIVDGEMGSDIAYYTGSTTGDGRNNEVCSQYSPITWQVDRKCHMISASSFDKLCFDMLQQRDDMSEDVHPHGSRETVSDELAANNQVRKRRA